MSLKTPLENLTKIVYVGTSMYPLLRDLDTLYYTTNNIQSLKPGDVIVYKSKKANKETYITHRIISIENSSFITKGDNNPRIDDLLVDPSNILGLVIYSKRRNKLIRIRNGKSGILFSNVVRLLMRIKMLALRIIVFPYHWVSKLGILRKFVPRNMTQRVINVQRPGGIESHLILGNYLVAKRRPGTNRWIILPPFKLFFDENTLPSPELPNILSIEDKEISL